MAFVVGVDSWVTVIEADAYLTYRMGTEEWFALTGEAVPGSYSKEALLGTACRELLNCPSISVTLTNTNDNVKNAQIEMALFLTEHFDELNDRRAAIATGLDSFYLGKRREDLRNFFVGVPEYILSMLGDYSNANLFVEISSPYDIQ